MTAITEFRDTYAGFSNFSKEHPVTVMGWWFPNGEAAFHAFKNADEDYWRALQHTTDPGTAKRLGRSVELRPDWEEFKDTAMKMVVAAKFIQHQTLLSLLFQTGDDELIEGNYWHDQYWGSCFCPRHVGTEGRNQLGKTIMAFRDYWRAGL